MNSVDFSHMTSIEIDEFIKGKAERGLDKFVEDDHYLVRKAVAVHGNETQRDMLVHDEDYHVRKTALACRNKSRE